MNVCALIRFSEAVFNRYYRYACLVTVCQLDSPSSEFDETNRNRRGRSDYNNFDSDVCGTEIYTKTCQIQTGNGYVKIWDRIIVN